MKIVLATKNEHKIEEIKALAQDIPVEILTLMDFPAIELPPEEGRTFKDNALEKARSVAQKTGIAALADDSGLEVAGLNGRPGVRSSRYAGEDATDEENNARLLTELSGVPAGGAGGAGGRKARFVCVLALVETSGKETCFEGTLEGEIGQGPRGSYGFGYDPLFIVPDGGGGGDGGGKKTLAELTPAEKNRISHRKRAVKEFKGWLVKNV